MAKNKSYWVAIISWCFEFILDAVEYTKENPFPKRAEFAESEPAATKSSERNSEARNGELRQPGMEAE